jgi:heme/copper-type cytochrome/quinol oxidase subunit 2
MWDIGTWILLAAVIVVVALIVVLSIVRGHARRGRGEQPPVADANGDNTLGDRRDVLRRARGRF